jgi:hypothetical protein
VPFFSWPAVELSTRNPPRRMTRKFPTGTNFGFFLSESHTHARATDTPSSTKIYSTTRKSRYYLTIAYNYFPIRIDVAAPQRVGYQNAHPTMTQRMPSQYHSGTQTQRPTRSPTPQDGQSRHKDKHHKNKHRYTNKHQYTHCCLTLLMLQG